jgi:hypothetical protein
MGKGTVKFEMGLFDRRAKEGRISKIFREANHPLAG